MKIKKNVLNCSIHFGIVKNPVNCISCQNLFCLDCVQQSLKKSNKCPSCHISPFKYEKNYILSKIIFDPNEECIECPKCKQLFSEENYDKHQKICITDFKCKLCKKKYKNDEDIKNHILNNENHINKLSDLFESFTTITIGTGIYKNTIKPFRYLNLLSKARTGILETIDNSENDDSLIQIKIDNIPKYCYLNKEMDLYFCNLNTNINCKCCPDHICQPGNCLCKSCMDINKQYHGLKKHYLINKAGRAARYSRKHFHCYCKFIKTNTNENNNVFHNQFYCGQFQYCEACEVLDELMDYYLSPEIVTKLKNMF